MDILLREIVQAFELHQDEKNKAGMARFGINSDNAYGIKMPTLRELAKKYKNHHALALELWKTGKHEARILAGLVDDPIDLTEEQMEDWVLDFNSWDIVDQSVMNLFEKRHDLAYPKAYEYCEREEEFVKRTGLVLMARLAFTDRKCEDEKILNFLPVLIQKATDPRNFVKKANNWALRQIGKRNLHCHKYAVECAKEIAQINDKSAKWIAADALRELSDEKVISRLYKVKNK